MIDIFTPSYTDEDAIETVRSEISIHGHAVLTDILSSHFLTYLETIFSSSNFKLHSILDSKDTSSSTENTLKEIITNKKIELLLNTKQNCDYLSKLLDLKIKKIKHRLYFTTQKDLNLYWHDDSHSTDNRFAAMRFELSQNKYVGGEFRFKNITNDRMYEYGCLEYGDAILFRIKKGQFYHMVEPLMSSENRYSLILFLNV